MADKTSYLYAIRQSEMSSMFSGDAQKKRTYIIVSNDMGQTWTDVDLSEFHTVKMIVDLLNENCRAKALENLD